MAVASAVATKVGTVTLRHPCVAVTARTSHFPFSQMSAVSTFPVEAGLSPRSASVLSKI